MRKQIIIQDQLLLRDCSATYSDHDFKKNACTITTRINRRRHTIGVRVFYQNSYNIKVFYTVLCNVLKMENILDCRDLKERERERERKCCRRYLYIIYTIWVPRNYKCY